MSPLYIRIEIGTVHCDSLPHHHGIFALSLEGDERYRVGVAYVPKTETEALALIKQFGCDGRGTDRPPRWTCNPVQRHELQISECGPNCPHCGGTGWVAGVFMAAGWPCRGGQ